MRQICRRVFELDALKVNFGLHGSGAVQHSFSTNQRHNFECVYLKTRRQICLKIFMDNLRTIMNNFYIATMEDEETPSLPTGSVFIQLMFRLIYASEMKNSAIWF